jgi:ABC-type Fe3+-hydroxamate transport system substrate-binding protein
MKNETKRVVCLVPSLTETLIEAGVNVVGRTRYCIHPAEKVKNIPIVGGTKDLSLEVLAALSPDLLILDKEENLPWMKEKSPCEVFVAHVQSVEDMPGLMHEFARLFPQCPEFQEWVARWQRISKAPPRAWDPRQVPGCLESWGPSGEALETEGSLGVKKVIYVIWKNPWMAAGQGTFIDSVLKKLGAVTSGAEVKYPKFEESVFQEPGVQVLFSSEPYPFGRNLNELRALAPCGALVDGESYSWFGVRAMRFLEEIKGSSS